MDVSIDKLPDGVKFKNSPENERFQAYVDFLKGYGKKQESFKKQLEDAKTTEDTAAVRKAATESAKDLVNYRKDYMNKYSGTLLANVFGALEVPTVPEGDHFLADGKTKDSTFAYNYYKSHFWENFNYQDDRLIHTPLLDGKLEEYMNKLVLPYPDSVEAEADRLLKKAKGTKDLFKYTLWWLTRNVENSKVMGMDEVFVYLVENYYMKGEAFWLTNEELSKYAERAQKIAPNVIGNIAPEVKLKNILTKKEESMQGIKANWTLLIFYSPDCGHCQKEIPAIDSVYEAVLKAKGCKVYTVATEGDEKKITEFLVKHKLEKWTNTWDPEHTGDWRGKFDVYSTPTIYVLDEKKIIRGKRLDHSNIHSVIEMQEKKARDKQKKN
jgi:thiol-disulfide isomerase/thioredoxin